MADRNFNSIHRFFHGDPVEGSDDMYSMSVGDTWLYFHGNHFVGVCRLDPDEDQEDYFYIYKEAPVVAKNAMDDDISNAKTILVGIDELVGHALRLVAMELSDLVQAKLIPNLTE